MAAPVWVLSVDLQTKTATFQSGMADAAKSARGAFTEIKSGSGEMAGHVGTNMFASRHAIMAVSEAFGVQVPRAITALITHLGPMGAALEAAFPFAGIALGAVLLLEKLAEMKEAGFKLTEDQIKFGTTVQQVFNGLDKKLLETGIRADELHNNHFGALQKQLKLIDMQSMDELAQSFQTLGKAADAVLLGLKTSWFQMGQGSAGIKRSAEEFTTVYEDLLAKQDKAGASALLHAKLERETIILAAQRQAAENKGKSGTGSDAAWEANLKWGQAMNVLKQYGVDYDEKAIKAGAEFVSILQAQVRAEHEIADITKGNKANAVTATGKESSAMRAEGARQEAEHKEKMGELMLAAERAQNGVMFALHQATINERLAAALALAGRELDIQLQANEDLQTALDKGGKDYHNQRKALQDKELEIIRQHENTVAALRGKATLDSYNKDLADFTEAEREKIEATQHGSAQRLAAIDAALKEEQARNLQNTQHYRELLTQRAEAVRQAAEEEAKIQAGLGQEAAEQAQRMGELQLAALREAWALQDSARRVTAQIREQEELEAAHREAALKQTALQYEMQTLDKGGKDYQLKLKELQDKEKQLVQAHENEIMAIKDKAEIERNQRILSANNSFTEMMSSNLTELAMGHKSFAATMDAIGNQVVTGMIQNAIKSILANDMTKESDAAAAARKAFNAGMHFPWPANLVMAPLLGAGAFAQVMAFAGGTDRVPGIGSGDVTPAMLTPGEGIVPGGVMDGLRSMARSGTMGGGTHYHAHVNPVYHLQALDTTSMERVLQKHAPTLQKHVENTLRKMNG